MDFYAMKSFNASDYMAIIKEMEDGFIVRIVRDRDGYEEVTTDFMTKLLFESCLRTGYIRKIDQPEKLAANS